MSNICSLCGSIDNLPFLCHDCKQNYCRKHCAYDKHNCANKNNQLYRYVPESELKKINKCSIELCYDNNTIVNLCSKCNKNYCNKHKSPWHKCIQQKKSRKSIWSIFSLK